ncbi:Endonuclease/exonuclease/phosphatase superfamily [Sesbania bispinosa]|nr:Endonuclease/exonuclease/phosphatase superfamily [Sesbania bispinosa]
MRQLWGELGLLTTGRAHPWALIRDFNQILQEHEKEGLRPPNPNNIQRFKMFIEDNGLIDMEMKGNRFTCFSNPRDGVVVRERIDRVLVNANWRFLFPHATGTSFKYEFIWDEHLECKEVVRRGWSDRTGEQEAWDNMFKKTRNCRQAITHWHRTKFCNAAKELPKLKTRLQTLQSLQDGVDHLAEISSLKKQIELLWKQEEAYWGQ